MTVAVHTGLRQGTQAWLVARRELITSTDLSVLLGINPWRCEADLADEKLTGKRGETNLRMKMGTALEDVIAEEYTAKTGRKVQRVRDLVVHPRIPWAGASPDRRVIGERRAVELKWSGSKARFADGIPQDVQSQVAWTLGVLGWDVADVAVLLGGDEVQVHEVPADPALFDDLVAVAQDFRRRLEAGGPFAQSDESLKRAYPRDNGVLLPATPDLVEFVEQFRAAKAAKVAAENAEKTIASALRAVLLDASGIDGLLTYRKNADSTRTNWPAVAAAYRTLLADRHSVDELDTLQSIHSETVQGPRVLRLLKESRDE